MRNLGLLTAILALSAMGMFGQNRHKVDINTETPEGKALQTIGTEQDQAKKIALMEQFAAEHASHGGYAWVLGQLHALYLKSNQHDKVFPVAEKLLSFDPSDAEMAYGGLQSAVAKNDPDLIVKWAGITNEAAKKGAKTPKPEDEDEQSAWDYKVKFSTQVQERCEYEVMALALRTADAAKKIAIMDSLKQLNPQSKYLPQLDNQYFVAYRQLGQNDKALALAEQLASENKANADMLLLLTDHAVNTKNNAKVIAYSDQLVAYMKSAPAPQGVDPAAWEAKKATNIGTGLFLKGVTLASENKLAEADAALREALPHLQGNDQVLGPALFQLGLANYKMGSAKKPADMARIRDAYKFSQQAAAIKGQHQGTASKNVAAMRQQYGLK